MYTDLKLKGLIPLALRHPLPTDDGLASSAAEGGPGDSGAGNGNEIAAAAGRAELAARVRVAHAQGLLHQQGAAPAPPVTSALSTRSHLHLHTRHAPAPSHLLTWHTLTPAPPHTTHTRTCTCSHARPVSVAAFTTWCLSVDCGVPGRCSQAAAHPSPAATTRGTAPGLGVCVSSCLCLAASSTCTAPCWQVG
jgi:hypothetical protein